MFKFFNKNFWVVLIFTGLISYGQILWMQPWEDDNALFFKMANIEKSVGFIGAGPLGEGVYKYGTTPFILIYKLFGFYIPAYFGFALLFYILTTLVINKVFSEVLNEKAGKIVSFFYACGYIVSDAYWRLANSVTTSISIIFSSLFVLFYFRFYRENKFRWYLWSLVMYFLGLEFALSRMHYFVLVPIIFEIIFLAFAKPIISIFKSLLRIIPFILIFKFKVLGGDARSEGILDFFKSLISGKFEVLYGFLASLANLVIPDWITKITPKYFGFLQIGLLIFSTVLIFFIFRYFKKSKWLTIGYILITLTWIFVSYKVFNTQLIKPSLKDLFVVTLGGILIIISSVAVWIKSEESKKFIFFGLWVLGGIYAYSSYIPYVAFGTMDRYLAHSFLALCVVWGVLSKKIKVLIIILAVGNLVNGIIFQNNALKTRSFPVHQFYLDLKQELPQIKKGDVLYFDIGPEMQGVFRDAIAAAMMPNAGSMAWRYGIDRYDLTYFTDINEFLKFIKENRIEPEKIHTFFYSKGKLFDTTNYFVKLIQSPKFPEKLSVKNILNTNDDLNGVNVSLANNKSSLLPQQMQFSLSCLPKNSNEIIFPYIYGPTFGVKGKQLTDNFVNAAFKYSYEKYSFKKNFSIETSSQWQDRITDNLNDDDFNTVWQADRVLWQKADEWIIVGNLLNKKINKIILVNGFSNHSPTKYSILTSDDKKNWKVQKEINNEKRYGNSEIFAIDVSEISNKYIKILFNKTLNEDSPAVSEIFVLSQKTSDYEILEYEAFLLEPFEYVIDKNTYDQISKGVENAQIQVYWKNDKVDNWQTNFNSFINAKCDGISRIYSVNIEAGGREISEFRFVSTKIPVTINMSNFVVKYKI